MKTEVKPTALVTGASSGMGKPIAKRLIADGYLVYVAARSIDRMADLALLGAVPLRMDISKDNDIVAAVEAITERSGGVDVLVNNAGYGLYGPAEEISLDEARYQFTTLLFRNGPRSYASSSAFLCGIGMPRFVSRASVSSTCNSSLDICQRAYSTYVIKKVGN